MICGCLITLTTVLATLVPSTVYKLKYFLLESKMTLAEVL